MRPVSPTGDPAPPQGLPLLRGAPPDEILDAFLGWVASLGLDLYPAQEQAILEIMEGHHVILQTPTGSGKSLIALALHYSCLCTGQRSVYTSPIKALVNEKFFALCRQLGASEVGMATGDATVNPQAPVLCCTAEVLANRALREGSKAALDAVVMDEFHFYSDRDRGVAWQIPLLTLPQARFLLLSATLGDTRFLERDLERRTGVPCVSVSSTDRPVPLEFEYREDPIEEIVTDLRRNSRLPAYLVHFSQQAATDTAQRLTSLELSDRDARAALAREMEGVRFNSPFGKDLKRYLGHGIAVHHAGLLPKYRILVERLAQRNLLLLICGTDTLGVGINVPIRTVVFTGLSKFDGQKLRLLPARDFHQIAGRAGRRGFDDHGFVLAQAPEHVIENRRIERKMREDPAKARKLVRKKPPDKSYVHWDASTFQRLVTASPEAIQSQFRLSHGLILNILGRESDGCLALRQLIRDCHEPESAKPELRRRAFALFRSLLEKRVVEFVPRPARNQAKVRLNLDLQDDFALNQPLALYLVDTVHALDRDDQAYPFVVLSLVESVLENPEPILRQQASRARAEKLRELKDQGVPYEDRMERLAGIEHPKPDADFIYSSFNAFSDQHPWVGEINIQPKSIAREMFEQYRRFDDYVRDYGLERVEGLLLRHLSSVYRTLSQTVPESAWDDTLREAQIYLETLLREVDSSIFEEWAMLDSSQPTDRSQTGNDSAASATRIIPDLRRNRDSYERLVRHAIFQFLRPVAYRDYSTAARVLAELSQPISANLAPEKDAPAIPPRSPTATDLESHFKPFFDAHSRLRLDPEARARKHTRLHQSPLTGQWEVEHTLVDPDQANDWSIHFALPDPHHPESLTLVFTGLSPIGEPRGG